MIQINPNNLDKNDEYEYEPLKNSNLEILKNNNYLSSESFEAPVDRYSSKENSNDVL